MERGWSPDGLRGVVDEDVDTAMRLLDHLGEQRDRSGRAQVQPDDLEPVPSRGGEPGAVSGGGVMREPGGGNHATTSGEQLYDDLKPNLDAAAGHHSELAGEVNSKVGGAVRSVQLAAPRADPVVIVVDRLAALLADLTLTLT